jgi:mRNA-degrading endonuclease RelE of RelBE toxin-antitoxin system
MDKIEKALNKLSPEEQSKIKAILKDLSVGKMNNYDLKKLKGRNDIYRLRKGKLRIIFRTTENNEIYLLAIERRSDNTYN